MMTTEAHERPRNKGRVVDARGRRVTQLDPVALHLLRRHEVIPAADLRAIALAIDAREVKYRSRRALFVPVMIVLCFAGFFGYFFLFNRWRGWDPVLIMFACGYFVFPVGGLLIGFRKARRTRWDRIRRVMLQHRYCPHCGYDLRGCPIDADDLTVCPECGCGWEWVSVGESAATAE